MGNEADKIWKLALALVMLYMFSVVMLQVCFRTQNNARRRVGREIVETQQKIAVAQANFASYARPEILRNLVSAVSPDSAVVSFNKVVNISDLSDKQIVD